MIHVHELGGCAPAPLAHYLKALGILRLVSEQADREARGWWEGEKFKLATNLTPEELANFFVNSYQPTPLVSPWNRGSGFYSADDIGLTPARHAKAERFNLLKEGIAAATAPLDDITEADQAVRAIKDETKITKDDRARLRRDLGIPDDEKAKLADPQKLALKKRTAELFSHKKALGETDEYKKRLSEAERRFKRLKAELIPLLRHTWRGPHLEWLNAALVLDAEGKARWPALLGTGGADGRLDFTNNFLQRLAEIFNLDSDQGYPGPQTDMWISSALWSTPMPGSQPGKAIGQYLPGSAGGANSTNGPDGDSLINPVDFILMMEGTLTFTAHATRRLGAHEASRAAAPFAVSAQGAGYASAADTDESARGEQWMPLWSQPVTYPELKRLFAEGRAQVGAKLAREPFDLARAVARLGTARGITSFQRFGYIERNGQSNLAVPIGRFHVPAQVSPRVACLDDLDVWLPRLRRESHDKHAPARLKQAERRLADALFAVAQHPDEAGRWQTVLLSLGEVEAIHIHGGNLRAGPIPKLRPEWLEAAGLETVEMRLALSCAMQASSLSREGIAVNPVRRHWLPRKNEETAAVMHGRNGIDDAIALVERRLIEASQRGERRLPLVAARKASVHPADLADWIAGQVDPDRTLALARALMALDGKAWATSPRFFADGTGDGTGGTYPDDAWLVVRLALLPWPLADGRAIRVDPAIFRRLASGDAASAIDIALRRLRAAGVQTSVRAASVPADTARLWAAALAFPINRNTAESFLRRLDPTQETMK